ncbi:cytochrome b5 [Diplodia corticola]|uniref:Cytochrome b5 n=1 Tax=Diplodia corticola TaxID=236234 RepID=A0A1J9QKF4_9PEZI|nr:cytochrome b5 [Diplodia corticola]OJD29350.1 cytochrome b5 [Diplodia corticola]
MENIQELSLADVAKHSTDKDPWICVHGYVYDVSEFLDDHPGGGEILRAFAGKDATEGFEDAAHSEDVKSIMDGLLVGRLPSKALQNPADPTQPPKRQTPTRQSDPIPARAGATSTHLTSKAKLGFMLVIFAVIMSKLIVSGLGAGVFFVAAGTATVVSPFVLFFVAATTRHRGADAYPDYIKPNVFT